MTVLNAVAVQADARKDWIMGYKPGDFLNQDVESINYSDFINKELILFSIASNIRALPRRNRCRDGSEPSTTTQISHPSLGQQGTVWLRRLDLFATVGVRFCLEVSPQFWAPSHR